MKAKNGVYIVEGEISILLGALRPGNKWSSSSIHDYELNPLVVALKSLRENLIKNPAILKDDISSVLGPFLEVVKAENTSGPVTEIALSSIAKFITYGLIDPSNSNSPVAVENIALGVTHARFVGTDSSSDEVVLMKVLQVLRCLLMSPCGALLSNDSVCEVMQSCFRICLEDRVSELLRRGAESILADMVQLLFEKIPVYPRETKPTRNAKKLKTKAGPNDKQRKSRSPKLRSQTLPYPSDDEEKQTGGRQRSSSVEAAVPPLQSMSSCCDTGSKSELVSVQPPENYEEADFTLPAAESTAMNHEPVSMSEGDSSSSLRLNTGMALSDNQGIEDSMRSDSLHPGLDETTVNTTVTSDSILSTPECETKPDFINPRGIRFTYVDAVEEQGMISPYGLPCVSELLRFLVTLINPHDKNNTDAMIIIGLRLVTVAIETGVDHLEVIDSLLSIVKDSLCKNLFALLNKDRSSIVIGAMRVCYLLFESLRTHLKLQLEMYLLRLAEIVSLTNPRLPLDRREIALEGLVQVWKLPGIVTEMYLNYDCDVNSTNLFEMVVELLQKNAAPGPELLPINVLAFGALSFVVDEIENRCQKQIVNQPTTPQTPTDRVVASSSSPVVSKFPENPDSVFGSRVRISPNLPTNEQLRAAKNKKQTLISGSEKFNERPSKGIEFLQAEGLLASPLDPAEVAHFLRENRRLDKKMIGEYISNRKNLEILEAFVKSFDFSHKRIDESLRLYLETFRLPGEAPLIQILMEMFAEHWHKANGEPFANSTAPFTLAYAVIMLNTDQHNTNAKKQNVPMTEEDFKRNLRGVNGGSDFDQNMLSAIYNAIRNEEIVMPAEQTGLVKENYIWKVLLRRGASPDGKYIHAPSGMLDYELFKMLAHGPIIQTLTPLWERMNEEKALHKIRSGFAKCIMIAAHYNMTDTVDNYLNQLSKFTIVSTPNDNPYVAVTFGNKPKAQLALRTLFVLSHRYGDTVRDAWKSICSCLLGLYKANLLPEQLVEVEDIIDGRVKLEKKRPTSQKQEAGLFSSLYSILASASEERVLSQEELESVDRAKECVNECGVIQLIDDSKFLRGEALQELTKAIIEHSPLPEGPAMTGYEESVTVFFMELLCRITIQNRDRALLILEDVKNHLNTLIVGSSNTNQHYLLDRSTNALLRLAVRLLTKDNLVPAVLQSLRIFLPLKATSVERISKYVVNGLSELLKTGGTSVSDAADWATMLTLLECAGAGARLPKVVGSENVSDSASDTDIQRRVGTGQDSDRGHTSDSELYTSEPKVVPLHHGTSTPDLSASPKRVAGGWIVVGKDNIEAHRAPSTPANHYTLELARELHYHDVNLFVKSCEVLAYIVRDSGCVSNNNYELLVQCARVFVEAAMLGYGKPKRSGSVKKTRPRLRSGDYDADDSDCEELPSGYQQVPLQLIEVLFGMYEKICEMGKINGEVWEKGLCPILQGIARVCCDSRKQVRTVAITYLQRALLMPDLQVLEASQWESCFTRVLFPLLAKLIELQSRNGFVDIDETRNRAISLLSKPFLQHLTLLLALPTFTALWLMILDFMDKYMKCGCDLLAEAIPESLKNMLLVMETAGVFQESDSQLVTVTWDKIETFLPSLRDELIRSKQPSVRVIESEVKPVTSSEAESIPLEVSLPDISSSTVFVTPCSIPTALESTALSPTEVSSQPVLDQAFRSQSPFSLSDYFQGTSPIRILPVQRDLFTVEVTGMRTISVDSTIDGGSYVVSEQFNKALIVSSPLGESTSLSNTEQISASPLLVPVAVPVHLEGGLGQVVQDPSPVAEKTPNGL